MLATAILSASLCSMMPTIVDDVIYLREEKNVTKAVLKDAIKARRDMSPQLRFLTLSTVTIVYAIPKGDRKRYESYKLQSALSCDNDEIIYGPTIDIKITIEVKDGN